MERVIVMHFFGTIFVNGYDSQNMKDCIYISKKED